MDVLFEQSCGLDIHKRTVVARLIVPGPGGAPTKEVRRFETMTDDLPRLAGWLLAAGCTQVAMESTGVEWQPSFNLLEVAGRAIVPVNARHVRAVPGRQTDVQDSEWLAGCPPGACGATGCSRPASSRPPRSASGAS